MGAVPKEARGVRSHGAGDAGKMLIYKIIIYILKKPIYYASNFTAII